MLFFRTIQEELVPLLFFLSGEQHGQQEMQLFQPQAIMVARAKFPRPKQSKRLD